MPRNFYLSQRNPWFGGAFSILYDDWRGTLWPQRAWEAAELEVDSRLAPKDLLRLRSFSWKKPARPHEKRPGMKIT